MLILAPLLLLAAFADSAPQKDLEVGNQYVQLGEQGDYQYGYNDGHAVKDETRSSDGTVSGSYRFVDANRVKQNVEYRADKKGFVAASTSELLADADQAAPNAGATTSTTTTTTPKILVPEVEKPALRASVVQVDHSKVPEAGDHFFQMGNLGDYQYGYNDGHTVKGESRTIDGTVQGSYQYVDANSVPQNVEYRADINGFVASRNNDLLAALPVTAPKNSFAALETADTLIDIRSSFDQSNLPEVGKQFFQMGKLGDYQYGYNDGYAVKDETRTADGTVRGSYRYVDGNSVTQNVQYHADKNGFVAASSNELLTGRNEAAPKVGFEAPIVVPDFDLQLPPEQHKVVSKAYLPYGYPVLAASEKVKQDNQGQGRSLEGQQPLPQLQQHPMLYVSFIIPYAVQPQCADAKE